MNNAKDANVLAGLHRVRAAGKLYVYAWRGGPRLLGDPAVSRAAMAEFLALTSARPAPSDSSLFAALIERFEAAAGHQDRKRRWRRECEATHQILLEEFGEDDIDIFEDKRTRKDIKALRDQYKDKPRKADKIVSELRAILSWAEDNGELSHHVARRIGKLHASDRAHIIWEPADIEQICAQLSPPAQRLARLAAFTGLDLADLCKLKWSEIGKLDIQTRRAKTGQWAIIPILAQTREIIGQCPRQSITVLTNTRGRPWTPDGYGSTFQRAKRKAEITTLRFKDFRGTAATMFACEIEDDDEVDRIMGWAPGLGKQIRRRYVDRERLATAIIKRFARTQKEQEL